MLDIGCAPDAHLLVKVLSLLWLLVHAFQCMVLCAYFPDKEGSNTKAELVAL